MTAITVIVPARDAAETIGAALDALSRQTFADREVVVVDNGSIDETAAIVEAHPLSSVRLIRRRRGDGPGEARNEAARAARGAVLAFTDADCEPEPDWLEAGTRRMNDSDLVQGRIEPITPPGPFDRTVRVTSDRGLFETANLFVRRDLFERLEGFRDFVASGRPFGEDADFGWRARRAGAVVDFAPEVLVRHAVFPGGPAEMLAERWRLRHFPALLSRVPELRRYLFARVFLSRQTAFFDLALIAVIATVASSALPALAGTLPYLVQLALGAARAGRARLAPVAVADALGDAIGFAALVWGSIRHRAPLF